MIKIFNPYQSVSMRSASLLKLNYGYATNALAENVILFDLASEGFELLPIHSANDIRAVKRILAWLKLTFYFGAVNVHGKGYEQRMSG